jgi:hypothetical protein
MTSVAGTQLTYRYRVRTSGINAEYPLIIDFYLAVPSDTAQGATFLGSDEYPVTSAGNYRTGTLTLPQTLPAGEGLVATATDAAGDTSQFTLEPVILEFEDGLFEDRFEGL